jgi:hypothetical protein
MGMNMTSMLGARVKEGWMAGLPPHPESPRRISGAYLSLIAVSFSELRKDLAHLLQSGWAEPVRRRAEELSSTLAKACERQHLGDLGAAARSLANLTRLSRANALPIQPALAEKIDALMRQATKLLAVESKRQLG